MFLSVPAALLLHLANLRIKWIEYIKMVPWKHEIKFQTRPPTPAF